MLSHKIETYLKTGDEKNFLEIEKIISEANATDLSKIHATVQSIIKISTKQNNDRMSKLTLLGLALGAGIGHFLFLLDPCAPDEVRKDMHRMQNEEPHLYFLIDALVTTAGSFGGLVLSFITQSLFCSDLSTRIYQLEELMKLHPIKNHNENKISTPTLSLN